MNCSIAYCQTDQQLHCQTVVTFGQIGVHRHSVRDLITSNSTLLAAKMADRSAEVGENYITRNRSEYFADMLRKAAGGGSIVSITIW